MKIINPSQNIQILISHKQDGDFRNINKTNQFIKPFLDNKQLCYIKLQHGVKRQITNDNQNNYQGDCLITNNKQHCLAMIVGDCFPVILFNQTKTHLSLIHCGWRSTNQNIIGLTINDLKTYYNLNPQNILAWIGPGIHPCCYKFKQQPQQILKKKWHKFINFQNNLWSIDLVGFIKQELLNHKIKKQNIISINQCTCCDQNYYSHYQSKQTNEIDGRFIVATKLCN